MDELDETVLNLQQRQKRAMVFRRNRPRIERAREIAKKRMAPDKNIKKRAYAAARQMVRRRVAGKRGAEYEKLGPTEKMIVDKMVESRQALIKKIALRLMPRIKQEEQKRLQSYMKGQALQNHGAAEGGRVSEQFNTLFAESFPVTAVRSTRKQPEEAADPDGRKVKGKVKGNIIQYSKFDEECSCNSPVYKAIKKKARKSGISEDILGEVYDRGMDAWTEDCSVTQQQYAFARVNSYINQGKSYFNEDADLHEGMIKSIKRGLRGWEKGIHDVESVKTATKSLSPQQRKDLLATKVAKGSPADLQQKLIRRELRNEETALDEVSSDLLNRYNMKSQSAWNHHSAQAKHAQTQDEREYGNKMRARRNKGMVQAYDKLDAATGRTPEKPVKVPARMKEDVELDEARPVNNPYYDHTEKMWNIVS